MNNIYSKEMEGGVIEVIDIDLNMGVRYDGHCIGSAGTGAQSVSGGRGHQLQLSTTHIVCMGGMRRIIRRIMSC